MFLEHCDYKCKPEGFLFLNFPLTGHNKVQESLFIARTCLCINEIWIKLGQIHVTSQNALIGLRGHKNRYYFLLRMS